MYYVRARSESIAKQPPQAMSMASFGGGGEAPSAKLKAGAAAAVVDTAPIIKTPPYVAAVGEINTIVDTIERKSTWGPRAWGSGGVGVAWPGLRWPTIARGFVFEQPRQAVVSELLLRHGGSLALHLCRPSRTACVCCVRCCSERSEEGAQRPLAAAVRQP